MLEHLKLDRLSEFMISTKAILFYPKNFLNFRFNAVELQSIVNFRRYGSKGYTLVVLGNSRVTFLGEMDYVALCQFANYVLVMCVVAV